MLPESAGWPRAWECCPWMGVGRWRRQAADDLSLPLGPVQSPKTGASSGSPGLTAGSIPREIEGSQMPLNLSVDHHHPVPAFPTVTAGTEGAGGGWGEERGEVGPGPVREDIG